MTVIAAHGKNRAEFEDALVAALREAELTPRTAVIRAGPWAYRVLFISQSDGPHTVLPGVGWIGLQEDTSMEAWTAAIVRREDA